MTNRSLPTNIAFLFTSLAWFVTSSFIVGCGRRTLEEQKVATEKVLQEIGVEPKAKRTENNLSQDALDEIDPSIVKQRTGDEPVSQGNATTGTTKKTNSNDLIDPTKGRKAAPKPVNTLDDLKEPWITLDKLPRETWEVQYLGNAQVGLLYRKVSIADAGPNTLRHEARSRMRVSLKGIPFEQRVEMSTIERDTGEILNILGSLEMGTNKQTFEGSISDGFMKFKGAVNGEPFAVNIEWKKSYRGPFAVEQSMRRRPLQPRESRTLMYFDPLIRKIIDGRLEASDYIMTPTMLDGSKELLEVRNIGLVGENGSQALLWVDKKGEGFKSLVQANDIMSFRTEPIVAQIFESTIDLRAIELHSIPLEGPFEVLINANPASVTYRYRHRSEDPFRRLNTLTGQRISSHDARAINVTVYKDAGPDPLQALDSLSKPDSGAIISSEFVPSNLDRVIQVAKRSIKEDKTISPSSATNTEKAKACRRVLQKYIAFKEFDRRIGTVTDTLKNRQANCIDHALLFASVCRAIDIPARIALGVKFNRSAETPAMRFHAWVEIRDVDRWVPMDSSDEAFPTSIDRIKMKESNFNEKNPYLDILSVIRMLPELEIQVLPK